MHAALNSSIKMDRFASQRDEVLDRIDARAVVQSSGCLLWTGQIYGNGYGQIKYLSKSWGVHRLLWVLLFGELRTDQYVCHKCDVRNCVNVAHLFVGSPRDNALDMVSKGRGNQANTRYFTRVPSARPRGEAHGLAKLDADKVRQIRAEPDTTLQTFADRFGVTKQAVRSARIFETWRHVV